MPRGLRKPMRESSGMNSARLDVGPAHFALAVLSAAAFAVGVASHSDLARGLVAGLLVFGLSAHGLRLLRFARWLVHAVVAGRTLVGGLVLG